MKKKKLAAIILTMSVMTAIFTGCGSTVNTSNVEETQINNEEVAKADSIYEAESDATATTEVITDAEEAQTEHRVVASSVAVVEILDAMGVPMAGVPTSSYDLPESVDEATRIGNPMSPDLEVIASLEPTVIVSVDTLSGDLSSQFETLGAEVCFVNLSSYDGLKESVNKLGEYFEKQDKAAQIIADFESREQAVADSIEGKERPGVLIIFGASGSFMAASEDTYVGDLVKRVGGVNVIADAPSSFSPVDMEYLAGQNPEYILFMAHANPEESLAAFKQEFETNEAWQNFDAVKNDKVIALETGYFGMSANLLAPDAMQMLAEILY